MSNEPKVFYEFLGPAPGSRGESERVELSLAVPAPNQPFPAAAAARNARRIALMRRDRQRAGPEANRVPVPFASMLRPGSELDPARRLVPAPTNDPSGGLDHLLSARGRAFTMLATGPRNRAEKREMGVVVDPSNKVGSAMEEHASSSDPNKRPKAADQTVERLINPQPRPIMPYPTAHGPGSGSGSGSPGSEDVILKGFLRRNSTGMVRIACLCHGRDHTPEEYLNHARSSRRISIGSETTCCYVTVSLGARPRAPRE